MSLDLNSIDLTAVEALAKIKCEYDQVGDRVKAMAERREKVSAEVWQRVHDDYRRRLDELAQLAAPLKQRAGEVYRSLRDELAKLEQSFACARLDREEIDFRHSLGEFDDAELKKRVGAVDERIDQAGKARARALDLKERFLAVVSAEAELDGTDDDTARMHAIKPPVQAEATVIAAPIKPLPAADPAQTMVATMPTAAPTPASAAPPAAPPPTSGTPPMAPAATIGVRASRGSRNPDATVVFRQGRLEPRNGEAGSVVQTLGLKPVSIGSDAGCDLQLSVAGVAKRHLEVIMTRAGFSVRDVAASGTIKINGNVVQEHVLADGDTLSVGPAQFNFRLL